MGRIVAFLVCDFDLHAVSFIFSLFAPGDDDDDEGSTNTGSTNKGSTNTGSTNTGSTNSGSTNTGSTKTGST